MDLKISIPTYRRNAFLDRCLDSLLKSYNLIDSKKYSSNISIYIYDNNPDSIAESVYTKYLGKFDNLFYIPNNENIGANLNIQKSYYSRSKTYVHVISDDDIVLSDYFLSILPLINKITEADKIGCIYLPAFGYDRNCYIRPKIWSTKDYSTQSCRVLFEESSYNLTLISSLILRVEPNLKGTIESRLGNLIQLRLLLEISLIYNKSISFNKYLVASKRENSGILNHENLDLTSKLHIPNNITEIFVQEYFEIFKDFNVEITTKHKSNHFRKFYLWEICRRSMWAQFNNELDIIEKYYHKLFAFQFIKFFKSQSFRVLIIYIITCFSRIFSKDINKIIFYFITKMIHLKISSLKKIKRIFIKEKRFAWVKFDGKSDSIGRVSETNTERQILASSNIKSVERLSKGCYRLIFDQNFYNTNFVVLGLASHQKNEASCVVTQTGRSTHESVDIVCLTNGKDEAIDSSMIHVLIFR